MTAPTDRTLTASTYLILEASRRYGPVNADTGLRPARNVRIVASRANKPATLKGDQVAVKITVEIPARAFDPLTPSARAVIPADLVQRAELEVTVEDASDAAGGEL